MDNYFWIVVILEVLIVAGLYIWFAHQRRAIVVERERILGESRKQAEANVEKGRLHLEELSKVKDEVYRGKVESLEHREGLIGLQLQGILERETNLNQQLRRISDQERELERTRDDLEKVINQWRRRLSEIAGITEQQAHAMLMEQVERESVKDAVKLSKHILESARASANEDANRMIATAIGRCSMSHSFDAESTMITLPNDEIKGRIIGRDGRNIKAFENRSGVTVIVDDSSNTIVLSCLDPIRRESAVRAMNALIGSGRINPSRIEEAVSQSLQQVEDQGLDSAREAVEAVGLTLLPDPVLSMLGRLKYRRSYSQNLLAHSIEVAHLAGLLAGELGMNVTQARRAGLLHDIGKAVQQECEGSHAKVGAEFLERNMESPEIVECVAKHHDIASISDPTPLTSIVSAADALSAARPGARLETVETYIKRFGQLEKLGNSIPGVEKCFALQAGRELRVFARPDQATDEQCALLAKFLAGKIQNDIQYPGRIHVTVIREHRCEEYAE